MTAEQRPCLHCGTAFTWTPASPRKRFCSQPCRLAWHDARHRQATAALRHGDIHLPGADNQPRTGDPRTASHDTAGTLAATPACPHCQQPAAICASGSGQEQAARA